MAASRAVAAAMAPALQRVADVRAGRSGRGARWPEVLKGDGDDESPLGNLFADAMREATPGTDAALWLQCRAGPLARIGLAACSGRPRARSTTPSRSTTASCALHGDRYPSSKEMLISQLRRPRFRSRSLGVSGLQVVVDCRDDPARGRGAAGVRRAASRHRSTCPGHDRRPAGAADRRRRSGGRRRARRPALITTLRSCARWRRSGFRAQGATLARRPIRGSRAPALDTHRASHDRLSGATARLVSRPRSSSRIRPAMHPAWPCCSFRKYRPGFPVRRALPAGRLAALGAQRTSGTRH